MTMLTPQFGEHCSTTIVSDSITELLRQHAKRLIAEALEAEVNSVIAELKTAIRVQVGSAAIREWIIS